MRWTCSRCGQEHDGLPFDWAFDKPAYWDGPRNDGDWLTEDLCSWTDDGGDRAYFIRGLISIPVHQVEQPLAYGVWSSLSEESFSRVLDLWDDPRRVEEPPYFGWLSNSIPGYPETLSLPMDVVTSALERRPEFLLHDGEHPLVAEQRRGVTMDRLRAIAELNMHA